MSDAKWFDGWVPWPELSGLAAAGRALLPGVPTSPAAALRMVTERLIGRRITAKVGEHDVAFTLTELDYRADSLRLATGKVGDVRIVAEDIDWPDTPLRRITVLARDVRLKSLPSPSATPASVGIDIAVAGDVLRERMAEARPDLVVTAGEDGLIWVRWARRAHWGHLTLEPRVDHSAIVLLPRTLHVRGRRFRAPARLKPILLPLPELPPGLRLTGVEPRADELLLHTVADEWPERLSRIPLTDLLSWATTAALTLTLPRLGSR
ncbi:LmeA family phospholipid-binding protein [Amycolatopsis sp. H20-H5]|uniref:LmeA family phospholipid-binding protein n=1 Tax=Amycolatopsis sp. H20-H5 TaxID=3046309 RepID=UPI002DBEF0CC|nr:LmeA family phospholipid-binding protein [Amycolatopsis sp. H20-H5]MEC3977363.1 LmeA family phospholipid-binding protein [Amycolatopsis sp. H20-H5]